MRAEIEMLMNNVCHINAAIPNCFMFFSSSTKLLSLVVRCNHDSRHSKTHLSPLKLCEYYAVKNAENACESIMYKI